MCEWCKDYDETKYRGECGYIPDFPVSAKDAEWEWDEPFDWGPSRQDWEGNWIHDEPMYPANPEWNNPYFRSRYIYELDKDGAPLDEMIICPPVNALKAWGKTRFYEQSKFKWAPGKMPEIDDSWVDEWLQKFAGKGDSDV